ncbi:RICIN domain-containing protein [Streptomyces sp. NPDC088766]|uniref:RICIN domain-containing protein n=1 Tax=Streptomyces sp. NPDC088766 TaxID=3365893 RepID=UPI00380D93C4
MTRAVTGTLAVGLLALSATTATAATPTGWDAKYRTIKQTETGLCMGESGRQVALYPCNTASNPITWQIRVNEENGYMIRNTTSTRCLDNNGAGAIYLSDCDTSDLGQRWHIVDCGSTFVSRLASEMGNDPLRSLRISDFSCDGPW